MARTSNGTIYHGEDSARTAGELWRNGDVFIVRTTGAIWAHTDGAWVAPPVALPDHDDLTGLADDDHAQYLLASAATDRTTFATNWTDLTDGGATTLHSHAAGGSDSGWVEVTPGTNWDFTSLVPSGATTGRYRLLNGVVFLSGAVRCTNTASAVAFTLPEGYRPAHLMRYGIGLRYSSGGTLRSDTIISVDTNGEVLVATSSANDSTHFDGISFPV